MGEQLVVLLVGEQLVVLLVGEQLVVLLAGEQLVVLLAGEQLVVLLVGRRASLPYMRRKGVNLVVSCLLERYANNILSKSSSQSSFLHLQVFLAYI